MTQVHDHPGETGRDHAGPEVVAALGGSTHERQLLSDARPVGRHDIGPQVERVPGEPFANR